MARDEHDDDDLDIDDDIEDAEIEVEEIGGRGLAGFVVGVAVGALLGAGIAILATPARGEVVRRRLKRRIRDFQDDAKVQLHDLTDDARREVARRKRRLRRKLKRSD